MAGSAERISSRCQMLRADSQDELQRSQKESFISTYVLRMGYLVLSTAPQNLGTAVRWYSASASCRLQPWLPARQQQQQPAAEAVYLLPGLDAV
jgi:hypothetical protein